MKRTLFIASGVPGSGKTTWIKNHMNKELDAHVSRDEVRFSFLNDDDAYFSKEDLVFEAFINQIQKNIDNDNIRNIYVDATHLNKVSRGKVIGRLVNKGDMEIIILYFNVPLEVCLERNAKRTGRALVPEESIKNMYKAFKRPNDKWDFRYLEINECGEVINRE